MNRSLGLRALLLAPGRRIWPFCFDERRDRGKNLRKKASLCPKSAKEEPFSRFRKARRKARGFLFPSFLPALYPMCGSSHCCKEGAWSKMDAFRSLCSACSCISCLPCFLSGSFSVLKKGQDFLPLQSINIYKHHLDRSSCGIIENKALSIWRYLHVTIA